MSIENMKRISETETEAASIRKSAGNVARNIVDDAKKQAAALVEQAQTEADGKYKDAMDEAEREAAKDYDVRLAEVAEECAGMKERARAKLPDAVKLIMGKVVNTSGSC